MIDMAKLTPAQAKALCEAASHPGGYVNTHATKARTLDALYSRFLIKREGGSAVITPSGRTALAEYERAEREAKAAQERASRPVPASAFTEPSARTAPVLGLEYEDEPDEPAVPDAWVEQLVTLLQHGARIVKSEDRWVAERPLTPFTLQRDRTNEAAKEAIRRGIARALPPTHNGTVRLVLADH